jgi:hypothetical protein
VNWKWVSVAVALIVVAVGPWPPRTSDTMGLDRNAVTALLPVRLPSAPASAADDRLARESDSKRAREGMR